MSRSVHRAAVVSIVAAGSIAWVACGSPEGTPLDAALPVDAAAVIDGAADAPPMAAMLTIDRTSVSFGAVSVGATSAAMTLTITNTGMFPSGTLGVALSGAGAASFATAGATCAGTLASGASCTVPVTFAPQTDGGLAAIVTIAGSPGGSAAAMLDGSGVVPAMLAISASPGPLGDVLVGAVGQDAATFTVTNRGAVASGALSVQATGANPADFIVDDGCATHPLAAGAGCTLQVRFTPQARGVRSASFEVGASPGGLVSRAVSGRGLARAKLVTAFNHRDLGTVASGASSSATLVLTNAGDVATGPIALTFTDGSGFTSDGGTCSNTSLAPGATCTVVVALSAIAPGPRDSAVTAAASPGGSLVVTLSGLITAADQLAIVPTSVRFPDVAVGTPGGSQVFTITNRGATTSGVLRTSQTGAASFAILADTCHDQALAPNGTCQITARFAPAAAGPRIGRLDVTAAAGGLASASLVGVARSEASLVLAPAGQGFGAVAVGATAEAAFTLTNTGGEPSGVPAVAITGAHAADYAAASTCAAVLAPGAACTITVRWAPGATGARAALLGVAATPGGSQNVALLGTGLAAGGLTITPPHFAFAPTVIAGTSAAQTFTVRNTGAAAVTALAVGGDATFEVAAPTTAAACRTMLAPGATCTFRARLKPTAVTASTGVIAATGGAVPAFAAVAGTGLPRLEVVAIDSAATPATSHDFGPHAVAAALPSDVFVTLRNNTEDQPLLGLVEQYGTPPQFRTLGNNCASVIRAHGTCTVRIRFAPTSSGPKVGTATFSLGAGPHDAAAFALAGTGVD